MTTTPRPRGTFTHTARCFLCTRGLVDDAGTVITVTDPARRDGACTECLAGTKVYRHPHLVTGRPSVPSRLGT